MQQWHLVQICNAGTIVGGTGACAWTITRSLPEWQHTILFLSRITPETQAASQHIRLKQITRVSNSLLNKLSPDIVIYHNTRRTHVDDDCLQRSSLYYRHSQGNLWGSFEKVACSKWLADQYPETSRPPVLYQAVPRPPKLDTFSRRSRLGHELTVGRLCTPTKYKWPQELIPFYQTLAEEHPYIRWEFVGCPSALQADLQRAVCDKARFHSAGWTARGHFWNWDVSLYHHPTVTESFGRTVAEAMRTGCIPVVDDRGGFREQIEDRSGYLCKTTNDFSTALKALADPGERIARSRRCRAQGDENFSLKGLRDRLLSTFGRVIENSV